MVLVVVMMVRMMMMWMCYASDDGCGVDGVGIVVVAVVENV